MLVHGAGSGPWVFDSWTAPEGVELVAVDLHEGVDVGAASMDEYAAVVRRACATARPPVALCGWSMGGLVAMMAADAPGVEALVLLEPSPPAEVQGTSDVPDADGTFDPEEVYGEFPPGMRARPESHRARADRKRGISVLRLPRRLLVVYGDEFAEDRGRALARFYEIPEAYFPGIDHWGLVLDERVRATVLEFVTGG
ncbi:MAG TPA: alpha/beta fold hydrolase [Actinomycetota bacterium]|nr:alpha/beta fold hydrolase [Actinomycetota bacterium]